MTQRDDLVRSALRASHAIPRHGSGRDLPASSGQEQTWLLEQLVPSSPFNHLSLKVRMRGPLDVDALRESLRAIHARHDVLRAAFSFRDGALVQQAVAGQELPLTVHDLSTTPASERSARLREVEADALLRPFSIESGPLVRLDLFRLDAHSHELLMVVHRLVADEPSWAVFQRELLAVYEAFAAGAGHDLPDLDFQFPDYAIYQRGLVEDERAGRQVEYWTETLASLPDALVLPFAGRRDEAPSLAGGVVRFSVPRHVWDAVRKLAEEEATSPFVVAQAAFVVFLHRFARRRDVVWGTPSSGRHHPGTDGVVGPFADMLPLRARMPSDPTWRDVVRLVRRVDEDARAHPDVPFRQLCEMARPERHVNMARLVQAVFAEQPRLEPGTVRGVTFTFEQPDSGEALYDVEVRVGETGDGPRGTLRFKRGLFEEHVAETMAQRFVGLLEQMASAPDEHFSSLSVLGGEEHERVVYEWNQTRTDYPRERTIHALFEEWADRRPDAPALRWEELELTYGQLERRANQLAHHLRQLGVGLETRVGLFFGYAADWVIGALATLKASGAYVPLDPAYPSDRLSRMCEDSDVQVLLVQEGLEHRLDFPAARRVVISAEADAIARQPDTRLPNAAGPDTLAYVMFTSGSTGRPKAIAASHRNVVRTVRETNYIAFGPTDIVGQSSNISFDASTLEVWGALLGGSLLVGLHKEDVLQPQRLQEQLVANDINIYFTPSALMKQIVSESPGMFGRLKYFLSGGEQADYHTLRRLLDHGAPQHFINPYGPTETTVFAVTYECNGLTDADRHVPIGYPIGNTTCYVLDQYLQPVPAGVIGELYVGGDGVARGYLGRPDMTAEKFIPDPCGGEPGARLYSTGDLGRHRPDGMVDFLGRVDRQVKLRGIRIEPGEIEACLMESGRVREVSIQVDRDRGGDQMLVAYVVPGGPDVEMEALREYVRARMPAYMVPTLFVEMQALPLNANGKLDARALRDWLPAARRDEGVVEPRTATEGRLDTIWRDVLGLDSLSVHDDFWALGGTSLKAAQAVVRGRTVFRCDVPFGLLFAHPTVASFADAVDRLRAPAAPQTARAGAAPAPPEEVPARTAPDPDTDAGARTETERKLIAIWKEVLDVEDLGRNDNFFALGGHSLNATRAVSRAKAVFEREIHLRLLFQNPTVASFASAIDRLDEEEEDEEEELRTMPAAAQGQQSLEHLLEAVEELSDEEVGHLLGSDA